MKRITLLVLVFGVSAGCAALKTVPNPAYVQAVTTTIVSTNGLLPVTTLITNAAEPPAVFVVSPKLNEVSNTVAQLMPIAQTLAAVSPAAPVAPFMPTIANMIFGGIGALMTLIAGWKNQQAKTHAAAAASLAATVVQCNEQPRAHLNAISNDSSAAVALHLASAASPT